MFFNSHVPAVLRRLHEQGYTLAIFSNQGGFSKHNPFAGRGKAVMTKIDTFTQELRLTSSGSGPLQWMAGAFYFNEEVEQEMLNEIPMKRFAKPEELGAVIAFLCSPAAAYINGINVPVDGGRTACL